MPDLISEILMILIISAISAIPLNIAVKILGGESSWLKAIGVNLLIDVINVFLSAKIRFGYLIISFILKLFIYKLIFRIGWFRAFIAWLLQYVIAAMLIIILLILGLGSIIAIPLFL